MIMDGELDHIPEAAFNLKGTIEEAIEAGEKMISESWTILSRSTSELWPKTKSLRLCPIGSYSPQIHCSKFSFPV